ncbi:helix-turn-helix domain-containing protein [Kitasatospora sp. NPDC058170]|uniref:helix-turn-helix domain-containing protein n=1 Tax=Kitasatospora sp. NPDC058170 TaxID=3346364 RepID=UPI0036DB4FCB
MEHLQRLGSGIRRLRRAAGLSQTDLAGPDFSPSYISLLEAGKRTPSPDVLIRLAARLGTDPEHLVRLLDRADRGELEVELRLADAALERDGSPEAALDRYRSVRERATGADLRDLGLAADLGAARALERAGRLTEAVDRYERLRTSAAQSQGRVSRLAVTVALCRCHRELGDLDHAITLGEDALTEVQRLGLVPTQVGVELLASLAALHCERGDVHRARQLTGTAIRLAGSVGTPAALGAAYWSAGLAAHAGGDPGDALPLLQRALATQPAGENERVAGRLRVLHAEVLLSLDPPDAAAARAELADTARPLADHGSPADRAAHAVAAARAELLLGQAAAARELADRALAALPPEAGPERARALLLLAEALAGTGDEDAAAAAGAALRQAAEALAGATSGRRAAGAWAELATALHRAGDHGPAVRAFRQALRCHGHRLPDPPPGEGPVEGAAEGAAEFTDQRVPPVTETGFQSKPTVTDPLGQKPN